MKIPRWLKNTFFVILLIVLASDFFIHRGHPVFFWDKIPGFWALFGLIGCLVLFLVSKLIGVWCKISRKEGYYD